MPPPRRLVDLARADTRSPQAGAAAAYGVGNLINAKTAHSQLMGGIVWGISLALLEQSVLDPHEGRFVNANLAEYHVPVNADIGVIEILVVPEHDAQVNPLGAKGLGEVATTGGVAAIANAVYHATGRRVRDLPITLDKLLASACSRMDRIAAAGSAAASHFEERRSHTA